MYYTDLHDSCKGEGQKQAIRGISRKQGLCSGNWKVFRTKVGINISTGIEKCKKNADAIAESRQFFFGGSKSLSFFEGIPPLWGSFLQQSINPPHPK